MPATFSNTLLIMLLYNGIMLHVLLSTLLILSKLWLYQKRCLWTVWCSTVRSLIIGRGFAA